MRRPRACPCSISSAAAVVAMPRSASSFCIAALMRRFASLNAAVSRLPSRLRDGVVRKRPGRVDVGVARVVDERFDDLRGEARRDFTGGVAAHAVGHQEQAEVGPRADTCPRWPPAAGRDGTGRRKRRSSSGNVSDAPRVLWRRPAGEIARSRAMRARSKSTSGSGFASRSSARRFAASARAQVDVLGAFRDRRQDRDAIGRPLPRIRRRRTRSARRAPLRYHISPGRSAASSGAWPGRTPKKPSSPGSCTSSTSSWAMLPRSGVTNSRRMVRRNRHLLRLRALQHFVDRPGQVERLLRDARRACLRRFHGSRARCPQSPRTCPCSP